MCGLVFAVGLGALGHVAAAQGARLPRRRRRRVGSVARVRHGRRHRRGRARAPRAPKRPLFERAYPTLRRHGIDRRLVIGAALFGVGWGLVGYCPGPAIVSLGAAVPGAGSFFAHPCSWAWPFSKFPICNNFIRRHFATWRAASRGIDSGHGAASGARSVRPPLRARRLRARLRRHAQPHRRRTTSSNRRSRSSSTSRIAAPPAAIRAPATARASSSRSRTSSTRRPTRGVRGIELPPPGDYGVAMCFFSRCPARRRRQEAILEAAVSTTTSGCLGWRDVPDRPIARSARSRASRCR